MGFPIALPTAPNVFQLGPLLRGEAPAISKWVETWTLGSVWRQVVIVIAGAGAFGLAMGVWRDPLQGLYAGIKLPLIVILTAGGNAVINGMFAPLLGLNLSLKQSFAAVLTSFTLACAILGAFSPLIAFVVWNLPPMTSGGQGATPMVHELLMVVAVAVIAFAGVTANLRLLRLLRSLGGGETEARRILLAWLTVNLLLGSQISWVLRPFVGAPELAVRFLRPDAFNGSFFETLFSSVEGLFS